MNIQPVRICLFVSALLLVTACGGGGSSGTVVTSTSPPADATGVARSAVVSATFNRDVLTASVDDASFTVATPGGAVAGTVSFDGNTNVATFTPQAALPMMARHTATLARTIADLDGNTLSEAYSWSFTTVDGQWQGETVIESSNEDAGFPQVALDAAGNALAVWVQDDGVRTNLWANYYDVEFGWGTPVKLENLDAGNASKPHVAMDGQGNGLAVWVQNDGTWNNIRASRFELMTQTWDAPTLLEVSNVANAHSPQVAMDRSGNGIAVWYQDNGIRNNVYASYFQAGSGWGSAEVIDANIAGTLNPRLAMNQQGDAVVVWKQFNAGFTRYDIWSNRYDVGSGWQVAEQIEFSNMDAGGADVALSDNGFAVAAWAQDDGTRNNIWASRYDPDSGWGSASLLENENFGGAGSPQATMDAAGNALVVWFQMDASRQNVWANRYSAGAGWGSADIIETNSTGNALDARVALDTNGNGMAVWYQDDGGLNNVWANRFLAGTGWSGPERIESSDLGHASLVDVATGLNSSVLAIWQQNDGVRNSILVNRFE
ncbi:Ig-like domain-containing protein [Marinobacter mobilis]|uniref:Ig-like domain-containing protein n=1 Tax=Marinobacter mobilis TaxID=488533 RepID=UPI0035C695AB